MPTNRPSLKAIALAVLLASGGVCAQDDPWYGGIRSGWDPGTTSLGFRGSLPGELSIGGAGPESRSAHAQYGGYRLTDAIAIEGAQTSYDLNGDAGCRTDALGGDTYRPCYGAAWSLAGVAILPFESGLSLYGRLGLHYRQKGMPDDNSPASLHNTEDVGSVLGVGVSYELSRAVTFRAESERYTDFYNNGTGPGSNLGLDTSVHSIGLSIKF
jgi:OOP family OmpA-OmpF porin